MILLSLVLICLLDFETTVKLEHWKCAFIFIVKGSVSFSSIYQNNDYIFLHISFQTNFVSTSCGKISFCKLSRLTIKIISFNYFKHHVVISAVKITVCKYMKQFLVRCHQGQCTFYHQRFTDLRILNRCVTIPFYS